MSIISRIKTNFFWGFLGETLGRGLMFILLVIFSRRLGPEYFGHFSFIQSLFMFAWISIDLGLGLFGTRSIATEKQHADEVANGIFFTRTTLASLIAIITILITLVTADSEMFAVVAGFSMYLILRGAQTDWLMRGFEDYRYLCMVLTISYIALFITGFSLVKTQQDFYLSSISWVVMGSIAVALGIHRARKKFNIRLNYKKASLNQAIGYWKTSIHFTLSNGISALYESLPIFFLFIFTNPETVGLYSAPFRLIIAAFFLVSIYPMTIFPVLSNLYKVNLRKYAQVINLSAIGVFVFTVIISLISWLYADEIIIRLFSEKYSTSIPAFKILLLFFVFRSVRAIFVRAICAGNGEKTYAKIAVLGLCMLCLLLSLLHLMKSLSLESLSISLVITEIIILLFLIISVRRLTEQAKP